VVGRWFREVAGVWADAGLAPTDKEDGEELASGHFFKAQQLEDEAQLEGDDSA
jgi:hypothetical protein